MPRFWSSIAASALARAGYATDEIERFQASCLADKFTDAISLPTLAESKAALSSMLDDLDELGDTLATEVSAKVLEVSVCFKTPAQQPTGYKVAYVFSRSEI